MGSLLGRSAVLGRVTRAGRVGLTPNYPATIPGLVFQLDAASLSASPVASWSYGAGAMVQATGASQPLWTASSANTNGLPSVVYDGTKVMSAPSTTALQLAGDMTLATVLFLTTPLPTFTCVCSKGANSEFDCYISATGWMRLYRHATGLTSQNFISANTLFSLIVTAMGSAPWTTVVYLNGVAVVNGNSATQAPVTGTSVTIGQRSDATPILQGEQPELLLINRFLSPIEIATLAAFWAAKYNLQAA